MFVCPRSALFVIQTDCLHFRLFCVPSLSTPLHVGLVFFAERKERSNIQNNHNNLVFLFYLSWSNVSFSTQRAAVNHWTPFSYLTGARTPQCVLSNWFVSFSMKHHGPCHTVNISVNLSVSLLYCSHVFFSCFLATCSSPFTCSHGSKWHY